MESKIKNHYNSDHLTQNIKTALIKAGKNLSTLESSDLCPIDQLHTGGVNSSIELLKKTNISPDARVLDAGCGIGGSSRLLAEQFGCRVTGIDLADTFINAANFLTACTAQNNQVDFQSNIIFKQGSILDLPFDNNSFDAILCQHVLMDIKDKSVAVKEFFRVLKPGGQLILHEITLGENQGIIYPVPWATSAAISFVEPWSFFAGIIEKHGFDISYCSDKTPEAYSWWKKVKAASQKRSPQISERAGDLGPGLIFGRNARFFGKNMHANFKNNCLCLIEAVLKKSYDK